MSSTYFYHFLRLMFIYREEHLRNSLSLFYHSIIFPSERAYSSFKINNLKFLLTENSSTFNQFYCKCALFRKRLKIVWRIWRKCKKFTARWTARQADYDHNISPATLALSGELKTNFLFAFSTYLLFDAFYWSILSNLKWYNYWENVNIQNKAFFGGFMAIIIK